MHLGEFGLDSANIAIGGFVLGALSLEAFFVVLAAFAVAGMLLAVGLRSAYGWADARRNPKSRGTG